MEFKTVHYFEQYEMDRGLAKMVTDGWNIYTIMTVDQPMFYVVYYKGTLPSHFRIGL